MTILLDQNIPRSIKFWISKKKPGWTVHHISEFGLSTASDEEIYSRAQLLGAAILTFDEDFTDVRLSITPEFGVIRLNIWPTTVEKTEHALDRLFHEVVDDELSGTLTIIDNNKIRIRKLK